MPEMSAARVAILDRIRNANSTVDPAKQAAEYKAIERDYQQTTGMDRSTILETFAERLREYDARVHEAASANIASVIQAVFAANGQRSVIVANNVPPEWLPEGVSWRAEASADTEALDTAEGALVACEAAIAHTGTIAVKDSRRLTLLPDHLLCVVRADQVVETVPEAFTRLQDLATSALTFISGPSATADIEMTRIRGVHGPRFLDVVLV